jgi:uncharacterized protein (DUF433 family)
MRRRNGSWKPGLDLNWMTAASSTTYGATPHLGGRMKHNVEVSPKVMMGKPVIRGTRITVENVLERLAAGESVDDILEAYPDLNRAAIQGALSYAAEVLGGEAVYPASSEAA